ncbi:type II toxin-antitoxin system death-on-curing family toxin [Sulfurisphaera ohwakuensis]|uniref:Death-on-curing family protein n=1 Tax=Sulfurisphaera ohwakuensis TaxID=69656 RepID=A0A650CDD0_SULOH|nr:type II toxin-antitoxin system death-on-curing family toxin [Sulfurisphaera ohwakuensis]MBB5255174.1 death-on-curing family protein [Sulfurisphaera ohwakuensis]QGR15784.1 type II toxin-antitoxin system death-on-curing family toxin [Sulfurisphaera ohwakuensis]
MGNKFQLILASLDKSFIIWLNERVLKEEDPSLTSIVINEGNIEGAVYSAMLDFEINHNISRSLAVLIHHLITGHPFADGNKRTATALLLTILSKLYERDIILEETLMNSLITIIAKISKEPENDILDLQKIIEEIMKRLANPY